MTKNPSTFNIKFEQDMRLVTWTQLYLFECPDDLRYPCVVVEDETGVGVLALRVEADGLAHAARQQLELQFGAHRLPDIVCWRDCLVVVVLNIL